MLNRHFIVSFALIVSAVFSQVCRGEESRMYVNMETLFEGYYKTLSSNLSFEERKQEVEDQLDLIHKEVEALRAEGKKHEADYRNELLAKTVRDTAARKLQAIFERLRAKQQEFERTRAENTEALQKIRLEREDELVKEIMKVVDAVADEKGCTELIEVSGKTFNRITVFLRYPRQKEITAEVLKRLNQGHEEELKTAREALERRRAKPVAAPAEEGKPAIPAAK